MELEQCSHLKKNNSKNIQAEQQDSLKCIIYVEVIVNVLALVSNASMYNFSFFLPCSRKVTIRFLKSSVNQ